jgi:4-hydroxybenzoate-CoA ligase
VSEISERMNITSYYLDRNVHLGRGDRTALYYRERTYTYNDVVALTNRVGNALKDIGVEVEDRVLFALNDSPEFVATWFGIIKIGAVAIDVYTYLQPKDYEYYINYTRAKVVIVEESAAEKIEQVARNCKFVKKLIVVGKARKGFYSFHELTDAASDRLEAEDTHVDDVALWKFTSGSTGRPKGVLLTHRNSIYSFLNFAQQVLKYREDDITLSVSKYFFGYARDAGLVFAFGTGATAAIFSERSTERIMFELIEKHRPTILINVPTMISKMLDYPDAKNYDLSCLRYCTSSAEALPVELYKRWKETFGVELLNFVGSAELYHAYLSATLDDVRPGSLGKIVPGYEGKIMNEEGVEVPAGEIGTLWVKGQSAGLLYWQDYEKSQKTFVGEWVNTGDLFRKDDDGYYWFVARGGEVLKVGGIFVAPIEIENCLLTHPLVKECAVVGVLDEQGLVKPKAFVVLRGGEGPSADLAGELQLYVKKTLAPYKFPRWVEFIDELPKDDRGKVRKRALT